jgi:hypothetical protein
MKNLFLPKDRDGALLILKGELYVRIREQLDALAQAKAISQEETDYYAAAAHMLYNEITFVRNLLDVIERS